MGRRALRRIGYAAAWTLLIGAMALAVNVVGIRLMGGADDWGRWLAAHRGHFFVWRLALYGTTAWGWWWMRERVRQREPAVEGLSRLRRVEVAAVTAIVALESSVLLR